MEFDLTIDKKQKLKNPVMLIGLPGIGLVGRIAIEYLVNNLDVKKVGEMQGSIFPPLVIVDKSGIVKRINNELYLYRTKDMDILLLTGDVQPVIGDVNYAEQHYYFAKTILNTAKSLGVKTIYTFAGLDIGDTRITRKPSLHFASNSATLKDNLVKQKIKLAKEDLTISGAAGLVIGLATEYDIDGVCILSETSNKLVYGDFDSAKTIVNFISKSFKIDVKIQGLEKEAKKITKAFSQIVRELKAVSKEQGSKPNLKYIR